jgi:hypothetical protein
MLKDADAGKFDVLVAWREDRLYRGVTRVVIELKERLKAGIFAMRIRASPLKSSLMHQICCCLTMEIC